MARRRPESHAWSLEKKDAAAVPNARIALALMRCVRRMPGEFPDHNFDDLGAVLAPVIGLHARMASSAIAAHRRARASADALATEADEPDAGFLHDRDTLIFLGEAFARSTPRFRPLFDKVERTLSDYVAKQAFAADRNVEMLSRLIELPAPEAALVRLAAAFCYGSIERSLFSFVDSPARVIRAVEAMCDVRGAASVKLLHNNSALARSGLLEALNSSRSRFDLDDLLRLSAVGEGLLGMPHEDEQSMARAVLSPMAATQATIPLEWPHLHHQHCLLKAALRTALDESTCGVNFLLYGGPGTGKTEFVRQLVADIGANAFVIVEADEAGAEASRSERLASLQLSQTFAGHTTSAVLVLDEAEDIFQNDYQHPLGRLLRRGRESKAWMNALLEKNPHPVIWISNRVSQLDPAYLRRFTYCLEFPATPSAVRSRIAHERLGAVGCSDALVQSIAEVAQVTPAQLDAAARFAHLCRHADSGADAAVESQIRSHLKAGGHAEPSLLPARATRFDMRYLNVAGNATPERVLQSLSRGAEAGGAGVAAALLFSGPPGTGKTQLAAEIAARLGRRLVVRTASDINSKWYGGSEANVAQMFRDCDPCGELLFLDEAEVLLGAREGTTHRADRAVTAEFLRWLEVFQGTFVCATNHAGSFDAALMRRFTFRIEFQPLRHQQRRELYAELALGWQPQQDDTPPALDAATDARLARMDSLTPGDFANASRRIKALGLPTQAWLDELEAEQGAKPSVSAARIGFL